MERHIAGIQQVGIGVANVNHAFNWYKEMFGMDIIVFNDSAEAKLMTRYTGDRVHARTAYLAVNMAGGGGFEIWQYTSRTPEAAKHAITLNAPGIVAVKMKCFDIEKSIAYMRSKNVTILQDVANDPKGKRHFWMKDPYENMFQVVENDFWFVHPTDNPARTGGVAGVVIVVSNMDASLKFYKEVLNYGDVVYDKTGVFEDLKSVEGGTATLRRALLTQDIPVKGPFSRMLGPSYIELIETPASKTAQHIFTDRYWGDLGYIHLCYDITDMHTHEQLCNKFGYPLTVNSKQKFDMGSASGQFAYNEDPDGTLIEYVQTFKLPLLKKLGLYLDLRKRDNSKPLPDWMLKTLRFSRVK